MTAMIWIWFVSQRKMCWKVGLLCGGIKVGKSLGGGT